jgi:hypothetical protein
MQARVRTVAFQGVDVVPVDVQVLIAPGQLAVAMVGLADKAVGESRERVRAALRADRRLVKTVGKRIGACLRHHRTKGLIRSVEGIGGRLAWEVA